MFFFFAVSLTFALFLLQNPEQSAEEEEEKDDIGSG